MKLRVTPGDERPPPAHPLARALAYDTVRESGGARILMLGVGNARNLPPFETAGAFVDIIDDDPDRVRSMAPRLAAIPRVRIVRASFAGPYAFSAGYAGALATSALLHGSRAAVERAVAAVANRLDPGGLFYATFGSVADPRFAAGVRLEPFVSAPRDGEEAGVPHVYFDRERLSRVLGAFEISSIEESSAAQTVGRWAHGEAEAGTMIHWFVRARKASNQ